MMRISSSIFIQILTEGYAFYRILDRKTEIVTAERSFILIHKQTRQIIVDNSICKSMKRISHRFVRIDRFLFHLDEDGSLNPIVRKGFSSIDKKQFRMDFSF